MHAVTSVSATAVEYQTLHKPRTWRTYPQEGKKKKKKEFNYSKAILLLTSNFKVH